MSSSTEFLTVSPKAPAIEPKISIIVPVYNAELYLDECLSSIARQSMREIEVVCVDDGSTDGSSEILSRYSNSDNRFKVVEQLNSGVSAARNKGLSVATGVYIMFVDSDDYIREDACEKLFCYAQNNELDIVAFGGKTFPTAQWADNSFAQNDVIYVGESIKALFNEPGSRPLMCNKIFKRSLLEDNHCLLDSTLDLGEDHVFQFAAFPAAKNVGYIKDKLYFYRFRETSLTNSVANTHLERSMKHLLIVRSVFSMWKKRELFRQYAKELCDWSTRFLYEYAYCLYPKEHSQFSREYEKLVDEYRLRPVIELAPYDVKTQALWMLGIEKPKCLGNKYENFFDLIVEVSDDLSGVKKLLDSLMRLPDRGFTIKLLHSKENSTSAAQKEFFIDGNKICAYESVESALQSCNSLYVGFLPADCHLVDGFLSTIFDELERCVRANDSCDLSLPDMIVYTDENDLLGVCDPMTFSQPSFEHALGNSNVINTEALVGTWHLFASPVVWNKLFFRERFVAFCEANTQGKQRASILENLYRYQSECKTVLNLCDFKALAIDLFGASHEAPHGASHEAPHGASHGAPHEASHGASHASLQDIELIGRGLALDNWLGICEKDALQIAMSYFAIALDLRVFSNDFQEAFASVLGLVKEISDKYPDAFAELQASCSDRSDYSGYSNRSDCSDDKVCALLMARNSEEYQKERVAALLCSYQNRVHSLQDRLEADCRVCNAQKNSISELNKRLDELNSSTSLKVARKLTAIPRKVLSIKNR